MQHTVSKPTADPVVFVTNHRSPVEYRTTFQNLTGAQITLTVSNQDPQKTDAGSRVFSAAIGGITVIAANEMGLINVPHTMINIAGTGTGVIEIVETG